MTREPEKEWKRKREGSRERERENKVMEKETRGERGSNSQGPNRVPQWRLPRLLEKKQDYGQMSVGRQQQRTFRSGRKI